MDNQDHDILSFNNLNVDSKLEIAKNAARKIESIDSEESRIDLYNINDFFIEVVYRKELKIIKSVQGIDASEYAEKYIELEDMKDY